MTTKLEARDEAKVVVPGGRQTDDAGAGGRCTSSRAQGSRDGDGCSGRQ
jgi:hypothetical protein